MSLIEVQCAACAHFNRGDRQTARCLAFPDGIPDDILDGDFDHTQPHEGDNGIRYESRRSGPASPPRAPLP